EQETNLRATLVLDTSASMNFGPAAAAAAPRAQAQAPSSNVPHTGLTKIDYARHLAACLAYLLAMQQDLAGLVAIDDAVRIEMPPGSSPAHLDRLFKALEQL